MLLRMLTFVAHSRPAQDGCDRTWMPHSSQRMPNGSDRWPRHQTVLGGRLEGWWKHIHPWLPAAGRKATHGTPNYQRGTHESYCVAELPREGSSCADFACRWLSAGPVPRLASPADAGCAEPCARTTVTAAWGNDRQITNPFALVATREVHPGPVLLCLVTRKLCSR